MNLTDFKDLIKAMPVDYQAFDAKWENWKKFTDTNDQVSSILKKVFAGEPEVRISRPDLKVEWKSDLGVFIIKTILWGYSSGMRGNNFEGISNNFDSLKGLLENAINDGISDWSAHCKKLDDIKGLGLSTYTKFLQFLGVKVEGKYALILDNRIVTVLRRSVFAELAPLKNISDNNPSRRYPEYLDCIHTIAEQNDLNVEQIEFFLFAFGLDLKEPALVSNNARA